MSVQGLKSKRNLVTRPSLIKRLNHLLQVDSMAVISAPSGFGKSYLLSDFSQQYLKDNPQRKLIYLEREHMSFNQLAQEFEQLIKELEKGSKCIVVIDGISSIEEKNLEDFSVLIRKIISLDTPLLFAIKPSQTYMFADFKHIFFIHAQMLTVSEDELPLFLNHYELSSKQDILAQTFGVPALLAAASCVQAKTFEEDKYFKHTLVRLMRSVFEEAMIEEVKSALSQALIVSKASSLKFCNYEIVNYLSENYPFVNVNFATQSFEALPLDMKSLYDFMSLDLIKREDFIAGLKQAFNEGRYDEVFSFLNKVDEAEMSYAIFETNPLSFVLSSSKKAVKQISLLISKNKINHEQLASLGIHYLLIRDKRNAERILKQVDFALIDNLDVLSCYLALIKHFEFMNAHEYLELLSRLKSYLENKLGDGFSLKEVSHAKDLALHTKLLRYILQNRHVEALALVDHIDKSQSPKHIFEAFLLMDIFVIKTLLLHDFEAQKLLTMASAFFDLRGYFEFLSYIRAIEALAKNHDAELNVDTVFERAGSSSLARRDYTLGKFWLLFAAFVDIKNKQLLRAQIRAQQIIDFCELHAYEFLEQQAQFILQVFEIKQLTKQQQEVFLQDFLDSKNTEELGLFDILQALYSAAILDDTKSASSIITSHDHILQMPAHEFFMRLVCEHVHELTAYVQTYCTCASHDEHASFEASAFTGAQGTRQSKSLTITPDHHASPRQKDQVISIKLLGGFSMEKGGRALSENSWGKCKSLQLIALLCLNYNRELSRQYIINEFWGHLPLMSARNNLYTTLSTVRTMFLQDKNTPEYLITGHDSVRLNTQYVDCDLSNFLTLTRNLKTEGNKISPEQKLQIAKHIEELYVGDLMLVKYDPHNTFAAARRKFREEYLDCMVLAGNISMQQGDKASALYFSQAAYRINDEREDVCMLMIRAFVLNNQRSEALEAYLKFHKFISKSYGMEPSKEFQNLYYEIVQEPQTDEGEFNLPSAFV
ncbi:MAG: BTAD domain-containing putative transcriptional regulator [Coriobacteriia bacterium]|nr:BTAD domain-containing putative transcriptional regulator [Coriobacteriia bacterium]